MIEHKYTFCENGRILRKFRKLLGTMYEFVKIIEPVTLLCTEITYFYANTGINLFMNLNKNEWRMTHFCQNLHIFTENTTIWVLKKNFVHIFSSRKVGEFTTMYTIVQKT